MSFFTHIVPPLYKHQSEDINFYKSRDCVFNTADPGTGKTRTILEVIRQRPPTDRGRVLILCPKSIMEPAWGNDIKKFTPGLTYGIASSENQRKAFMNRDLDIVIANHDAVRSITTQIKRELEEFNTLIIDESTAFKNPSAVRSKKLVDLSTRMQYRSCLSGTPTPNSITDLWNQVFVLDKGTRLGSSFYGFRAAVCNPIPVSNHPGVNKWVDKPGIETVVGQLIQDITIRRKLEDCMDLPEQVIYSVFYTPKPQLMEQYRTLKRDALLELSEERDITAVHAGVVLAKLLQLLSGAVYDNRDYSILDENRYDLILDLIEERPHSLCTFNWRHQRDLLTKKATDRKIPFAVIDGETPGDQRTRIVDAYQNGEFKVLFAHPQSAGHGLTLTRGSSIIWASPTYNLEHFTQFNRRIYRAGQDKKTEIILVHAPHTVEDQVYTKLQGKQERQLNLLEMLS